MHIRQVNMATHHDVGPRLCPRTNRSFPAAQAVMPVAGVGHIHRLMHHHDAQLRRIKVATDGEIVWMQTPLVFEVAAEPLLLLVPASADLAAVE